jgi:hypothetical protein
MIGLTIEKLLTGSGSLTALVPVASIFPYAANNDIKSPYIVYSVDSIEPTYDKNGWAGDMVTFSVASFSTDYAILQSIILEVRDALEWKTDTNMGKIYFTGIQEAFADPVYRSELGFKVNVNSY